jgi:hypothetical protein
MRTFIILISIILTTTIANAEGLNSNATYIKKNFPTEYENTLKKYALAEWNDDFSMVVYEINKQADAIMKLVDSFESDNTNIAFKAIQEWSRDGYLSHNIKIFKEMTTFGLKDLLKMHCDWSMVKYEYDKQVKAKNAF